MYTKALREVVFVPVVKAVGATKNSTSSRTFTFTGTQTGQAVPEWKSRIEKGQVASSPYSKDMTKLVLGKSEEHFGTIQKIGPPLEVLETSLIGHPAIWWQGGNTLSHLAADASKARSMALSKLYKKLESDRSEMNAAASLAEIGDVLRQFGRPFGAMLDAFSRHQNRLYFERRRLVGRSSWREEQFRRIAAETWLETSFGLIPVIADAVNLAEAFGRWQYELSDSPKLRDRMRSRANDLIAVQNGSGTQVFFNIACEGTSKTETDARAQYVVGLKGEVRAEFGSNDRLLELLGLEPRNIPLAIWEATPWSWLVDYGTNVQQILQAGATITSRVEWIVLSETKVTTRTSKCVARPDAVAPWGSIRFRSKKAVKPDDFEVKMIRTTFNRTIPTSLGVPPLYFKSPLGDVKKMANLLAIAVVKGKDTRTWLS